MIIKYDVPGNKRKNLAKEIAKWLCLEVKYLGTPSFAYEIGACSLDSDGVLTINAESDNLFLEKLLEHLENEGYKRVDEKPIETEITDETKEIKVTNIGFEESKPIMTLFGKDTVEVSVNGHAQFQINIDEEYVTVNSKLQECYKDNMYNLKNHNMGGEFPVLQPGENVITWTGTLTKLIVYPESRWL